MKKQIMLWMTKYILKHVNNKLIELENISKNDVSFTIKRYKQISSSLYDLRTELYKECNK